MKLKKKIKTEKSHFIVNQSDKEIIITQKYVDSIISKMEKKQINWNSIKQFLKIFRFIVNEDLENKEGQQENDQLRVKNFFLIKDSAVYTQIMTFAFQSFPNILNNIVDNQKQNRKTEIVFKVFVTNFFKFMNATTDEKIQILCLKSLNLFIIQIIPFKSIFKKYSKFAIEQWATADKIQLKLHAFIVLQKICQNLQELEPFLRKIYLSYVKNTKQTNIRNYQLIQFMINCFKELLQINPQISYFIGFSYIRQIAVHLKMGYREKSQENIFMIYNWQYLNTIKLWAQCVSIDQLQELQYPLIQIIHGILNLYFTEQFFPLYLHLIQTLININQDSIVNIWKFLIKMLNCQNFSAKRKTETARDFDFQLNIKIQNKFMKINGFWNDLFQEIVSIFMISLARQSQNVFFPEITVFIIKDLKNLKKQLIYKPYKLKIQNLIKLIQERMEIIKNLRLEMNPQKFDNIILGENQLFIQSQELEQKKELKIKEKIVNQNEHESYSQEELPQEKKKKEKKKKVQKHVKEEKQISEASSFVDEGPDDQVFGNDEILSELEESLEGDPDIDELSQSNFEEENLDQQENFDDEDYE